MKQDETILNTIISNNISFAIEIFPSKTKEKETHLIDTLLHYQSLGVVCVNVTCKPGNSISTFDIVKKIRKHTTLTIIPHISVHSLLSGSFDTLIRNYMDLGVNNVFLVRGDLAENKQHDVDTLPYAQQLIIKVREISKDICIGVAGYPTLHHEQPNFMLEMQHIKSKVEAGANYIITQMFFETAHFIDFVDRCRLFGIDIPIIPGITQVKSMAHLKRLAELALGTVFPTPLLAGIFNAKNDTEAFLFGEHWCHEQTKALLHKEKVTHVHFFTFNSIHPFLNIIKHNKTYKS